jgi:gamma-glutamylcyclotransferase (GGCT)/AIG2-like uncharacterized protein YtfP
MKLYFAYGSNMDREQMNDRCPDNERIGRVILRGYKWYISSRGYASIRASKDDYVEGYLYRITHADEQSLDGYEGFPDLYQKHTVQVQQDGAMVRRVMVYIDPVTEEGEPRDWYPSTINQGIADAELSDEYVAQYIRPFIPA